MQSTARESEPTAIQLTNSHSGDDVRSSTTTSTDKWVPMPKNAALVPSCCTVNMQHLEGTYYGKVSSYDRLRSNVSYMGSQLIIMLSQLSPIVQCISCLIILLYLVQFGGEMTVDLFTLVPVEIISPGQWYHTALAIWSHGFLETSFSLVILDMLILAFSGTLIEPLWGHREVMGFMAITIVTSSMLTCLHYLLLYCVTFDESNLFNVRIHGMLSFCGGLSVAVKQLLPQSVLFSTAFGRLKNDDITFSISVLSIILYMLSVVTGSQVMQLLYGILVSWIYLRFIQAHTRHRASVTTITRGDLSDSLAFETFFPNVLRPLVSLISNYIYQLMVRLRICPTIPSAAAQLLNEHGDHELTNQYYHSNRPLLEDL